MTDHRYTLHRDVAPHTGTNGRLLFCMLNPSTADDKTDDPIVRWCLGFAQRLNYNELRIVNLFAARATSPDLLTRLDDPIGPENDRTIDREAKAADCIVAAWGTFGAFLERDRDVLQILSKHGEVMALGCKAQGMPRHPLYLSKDAELRTFYRGGQR